MSAHARRAEAPPLTSTATTDEEWEEHMGKPGLRVVDVYAKWGGPCEPMQTIFKRLKMDYGESVAFIQAQSDNITVLTKFRDRSCPTFMFFFDGSLVKIIKGANAPLIERTIKEQLELAKNGQPHVQISMDDDAPTVATRPTTPATDLNDSTNSPTSPTNLEETIAIIKPDGMAPSIMDQIMDIIRRNRFEIKEKKKIWMDRAVVEELYKEHSEQAWFGGMVTYLSTMPVLVMVLAKENAIQSWRDLMGPANSKKAREEAPSSIRALFGTDNRLNAVYGSLNQEQATRDYDLFFNSSIPLLEMPFVDPDSVAASPPQSTLALIKPDIAASGKVDEIVERIVCAGFHVAKREEIHLSAEQAAELYTHLREQPYYQDTVNFMCSGPVIALMLKGDDVIGLWREMIGPTDPVEAREKYPMSIRAIYGTDIARNAVHGADTPDSALRAIQLLFPRVLMKTGSAVYGSRPATARKPRASVPADSDAFSGRTMSTRDMRVPLERTLALIKPDAMAAGKRDEIMQRIRNEGFTIVAEKEVHLSLDQVQNFYKEHDGKPFYQELIGWISGAPVYAVVLEKESGISAWRELAGPTNSVKAKEIAPNSIRGLFGTDGSHNAVHGSDSPASAEREINIVFNDEVSPHPEMPPSDSPVQAQRALAATTSEPLGPLMERTLALIKPDAYATGSKDEIVRRVKETGFTIVKEDEVRFSIEKAAEFYKEHAGKPFYETLTTWMSSEPIYAMVLEKEDAIKGWRELAGPTNSEKARETAPQSIRAIYGTDGSQNAVHGSDSPASAAREIEVVFGSEVSPYSDRRGKAPAYVHPPAHSDVQQDHLEETSPSSNAPSPEAAPTNLADLFQPIQRTLALIKPDAFGAGRKEDILTRIRDDGFSIVKEKEITFTQDIAKEFYVEHDGKPFYETLVGWMSSAPIYALVLEREDAIAKWRALAGPTNSEKARETSPQSIRALYGTDGSQNAVHGSDSPTSAAREIKVVFGDEVAPMPPLPALPPKLDSISALFKPTEPDPDAETTTNSPDTQTNSDAKQNPAAPSNPTASTNSASKPVSRVASVAGAIAAGEASVTGGDAQIASVADGMGVGAPGPTKSEPVLPGDKRDPGQGDVAQGDRMEHEVGKTGAVEGGQDAGIGQIVSEIGETEVIGTVPGGPETRLSEGTEAVKAEGVVPGVGDVVPVDADSGAGVISEPTQVAV